MKSTISVNLDIERCKSYLSWIFLILLLIPITSDGQIDSLYYNGHPFNPQSEVMIATCFVDLNFAQLSLDDGTEAKLKNQWVTGKDGKSYQFKSTAQILQLLLKFNYKVNQFQRNPGGMAGVSYIFVMYRESE